MTKNKVVIISAAIVSALLIGVIIVGMMIFGEMRRQVEWETWEQCMARSGFYPDSPVTSYEELEAQMEASERCGR
jgi:hypothetical protein